MKILFTNIWQSANTGDNAIWKSMAQNLVDNLENVEFIFSSQQLIDWDLKQLKQFKIRYSVTPNGVPTKQDIEEADVVISQGGGYMIGDGMAKFLEMFDYAQQLNKPTIFATQTFVGPINDSTDKLLNKVLNKANLVVAREPETLNFLKMSGVKNAIMLPDQVFTIKPEHYVIPDHLENNLIKIGIRSYSANKEAMFNIAKLSDMITETFGQVVFIPVGHGGNRNDIDGMQIIKQLVNHEPIFIEEQLTANQLMSLFSTGMVISDRYHGIIYSASMCTPFLAMSPDIDFKMPGLLRTLDYPIKNVLSVNSSAEDIFKNVKKVWVDRDNIKKHLEKKVPQIKIKAKILYNLIIDICKSYTTNH